MMRHDDLGHGFGLIGEQGGGAHHLSLVDPAALESEGASGVDAENGELSVAVKRLQIVRQIAASPRNREKRLYSGTS